ncbi:toll/interleukin-1 receptor domain-containing protein [Lentzea sp. NEAU-D7]|uniref:toll/interleukin-1 receptor domain-containing protein n=1 Tax=Lentzea sp. NEAU-D7 TaxID=2994667 RepID=UPI00224B5FC6|nr:toll/interleukin-1 receptor domain-containing protein [Lentzea sp. NEAU-D7]MCX2947046.1 toll/interleukin-1 receptor domain-containing protein [Lentzea sp. NEAU-D7]
MLDRSRPYDLAVSFAGAQRPLAEGFVRACEALGLDVFYDKNVTTQMWGRNFIYEFRRVYGGQHARYVVPFLSKEYLAGPYPMDEFNAAVVHSLERGHDPYLLPITVGGVRIPENLLSSSIAYLRAEDHAVEELARITAERVAAHGTAPTPPASSAARPIRLPTIAAAAFSEHVVLESALARIGELFQEAAPKLVPFGYACRVHVTNVLVQVHLEERGSNGYGLRVRLADTVRGGRLDMSFGRLAHSHNGINAHATAVWDARTAEKMLRFDDYSAHGQQQLLSAEDLFEVLWHKIIDYIERTHDRRA